MRERTPLIAAVIAAILALAACNAPGPSAAPRPQQDTPERGGDHGGGGMM
jgi:hypothetical protein